MSYIAKYVRENIFKPYSQKFKRRRKKIFYDYFRPEIKDKILDFGGDDGSFLNFLISFRNDELYVADISKSKLEIASQRYGFKTIYLDESGKIPFPDDFFDIVFCNSVIEHVTVDKSEMLNIKNDKEFIDKSIVRQRFLADEIRRTGKKYFVQTPYKHFIIESHTWFPSFFIYLPRTFQIKLIKYLSKYWLNDCDPDINLLTYHDMKNFFPEAHIIREKSFFLTKSLIAVKI